MTSEHGSLPSGRILLAIVLVGFLLEAPTVAPQSVERQEPDLVTAALTLVDAGDRSPAIARLRALADDGDRPAALRGAALYHLGRLLHEDGETEAAVERLEAAVRVLPDDPRIHHALAEAMVDRIDQVWLVKKLGLARGARDSFRRAVELDPAWMEARISLLGFYLEAPRVAGGSLDKAAEQAAAIAELDRARGHWARAAIWHEKERYDLEATELRGAIQLEPEKVEYRQVLGRLYQRLERWDDAHEAYEEALRIDPRHGPSLYRLGRGAALSGTHLERGAQALRAYLDLEHPDEAYLPWVHYELGRILRHQGDEDAARRAFAEALRLDPDHEQAREALASLDADR